MCMALKQEILVKVPVSRHQEPEVQALLDNVKKHNLQDKRDVARFLEQEIASAERWLQQNRQTTAGSVRLMKEKAVELEMLRGCQELSRQFLG